jgi:hypothetical protein
VHLIGAEGSFDAVHLAEDVSFSSNTQSYWRPPLGSYDGGTTVTFILSPGDTLKTIWAVLDSGGESFSTPPTSATLILDTTQPDVTSSTLQTQPNLRFQVTMEFSEPVHEFTADDIWLGGVAISVENFTGDGMEYSFDVVASGEGALTIGFYTDDVFDLAGNPVIEQASPLVEYYPFIPLETSGATESATLTGGLFGTLIPPALSLEEQGGGMSMLMGTMDPVWVDFDWQAPLEGTEEAPLNTLEDGLISVTTGGTIIIKAGTSAETLTIGQAVRLEASDGTARIGDQTAAETSYIISLNGIPANTPENGVIAQVVRGSGAVEKTLEIESVEVIVNGTPTTISNDWFDLESLGDGNYNIVWTKPSGIDLSDYDEIRINIDRDEGGTPVHDETLTLSVTNPEDVRWAGIVFGSSVDVWKMTIPPHTFIAQQQTVSNHFYPFDIGQEIPIKIEKHATVQSPPPDPYFGWNAFALNLTAPVGGWQSNPGYWVYDPANVVGPERDISNVTGGEATLFIDDFRMFLASSQPVTLSAGTEDLFLTRINEGANDPMVQRHLILSWRGLDKMKTKGFGTQQAEVKLTQTDNIVPLLGRVRVYASYNGADPVPLMSEETDEVVIPLSGFDTNDRLFLLVEGADPGFGSLTAEVYVPGETQSIRSAAVNYHVLEPFTMSLSESSRPYNEKRLAVTMEPDLAPEPEASESAIETWKSKRRLVLLHDCGTAYNGTTTIRVMDDPPVYTPPDLPVWYAYDQQQPTISADPNPGYLHDTIGLWKQSTKTYDADLFLNLLPDYKIRIGIDTNENNQFEDEETLVAFEAHLVTDPNFNLSALFLQNLLSGEFFPVVPTQLSHDLFWRFRFGEWDPNDTTYHPNSTSQIVIPGSNNSSITSLPFRLTHDFGSSSFTGSWENLTATVPLYIYDDDSAASNLIINEPDFQESVRNYIASPNGIGYIAIDNQYVGPGTQPMSFSNQSVPASVGFYDGIFKVGTGAFSPFGDLQFDVTPDTQNGINGYNVTDIAIGMEAKDLFDFNFFNLAILESIGLAGPQAGASYQSGFGSLCNYPNGEVFVTEIHFNDSIQGSVFIPAP